MASGIPPTLRDGAADELERLRLKVKTLGAAYAQAVQTEGDDATAVVTRLLDPKVSLKSSVRDVLAFWIDSVQAQANLCRTVCATLHDPQDDPDAPSSGVFGGEVIFYVAPGQEATDPVAIDVPVGDIASIQVVSAGGAGTVAIPPENVYVSVSSDGSTVQVALIDLHQVLGFAATGLTGRANLQVAGVAPITIPLYAIRIA